jgi:proteasome activator subunit 4
MPAILSKPEWAERVVVTVTTALTDERVEVREKAAVVLGGLVHCRFIDSERRQKLLVRYHSVR